MRALARSRMSPTSREPQRRRAPVPRRLRRLALLRRRRRTCDRPKTRAARGSASPRSVWASRTSRGARPSTSCSVKRDSPSQHPRGRRVAPRPQDSWDFDDVRDHYVEPPLRSRSPRALRQTDLARYIELRRWRPVSHGHAMTEWRRTGSECAGALVWFLRDLWDGAGWGLIDARGRRRRRTTT